MKKEPLHINSAGFSLVEILVSIAVFLMFVLATIGVTTTVSQNTRHVSNREQATLLAEEAIEASRNLRDANFSFTTLPDGTYGLTTTGNQWNLSGGSDTKDIFTRTVSITSIHVNQKKVTVTVTWQDQVSQNNTVAVTTYLTRWREPLNIGLTVNKTVINHGGTSVASDFLPVNLTTLAWDNSVDPPVQNYTDIPIVFSPSTMTLGTGTYTFSTSNDPNYGVTLSSDCTGNTITLADGDAKLCTITYEQYVVPTVTTPTHSAVGQTTATLGATVASLGYPATISARGTCWGTSPAPTTNCLAEGGTSTGVFTHARTGLTASTTYYYRGYATNSFGTGYSTDGTFTTASIAVAPTVTTTSPVVTITKTTAVGGGNVTSDGGASVTARGVVWSTTANPTIALATKTTDGTGTGVFVSNMSALTCNTLYHVRAYATNSIGTSYGSDVTFTTAACSSITYVGSATAGGTTASIPAHLVGDLLVAFAYRDGNNTAPTVPAGWTSIAGSGGANNSGVIAYRIATGVEPTTGWTSANEIIVHVYRGVAVSPIGANTVQTRSGTSITYPTLSLNVTDGSSWVIGFAGHRSINTTLETAPTGMTNRSTRVDATAEVSGHDTNGGVSSRSATSVSVGGTSSGWITRLVEIKSQ